MDSHGSSYETHMGYTLGSSRFDWVDDERNVSQVFLWDCHNSNGCRTKTIFDGSESNYNTQWRSMVSKNYEFESRFRGISSNMNMKSGVAEYERQINKKVDDLIPVSQLSDELALCFERLTRPKKDIFEEFDEYM